MVRALMRFGIQVAAAVDLHVRSGEGVVRVGEQILGRGVGHEAGVVADVGAEPDAALADVVEQRALGLELLVVVDEERSAGDGVDRLDIEEEAADRRRHVDGVGVAEGDESTEAVGLGQLQPYVPAIVTPLA